VVLHSSNPFTNNIKCFVVNYGKPSLGKILCTITVYDIRLVHNINFFELHGISVHRVIRAINITVLYPGYNHIILINLTAFFN
jgi:hypothetical protein